MNRSWFNHHYGRPNLENINEFMIIKNSLHQLMPVLLKRLESCWLRNAHCLYTEWKKCLDFCVCVFMVYIWEVLKYRLMILWVFSFKKSSSARPSCRFSSKAEFLVLAGAKESIQVDKLKHEFIRLVYYSQSQQSISSLWTNCCLWWG